MRLGPATVACTLLSTLATGAPASSGKKTWGSSGTSDASSSMQMEPTTAYVQDLQKTGGNIPESGSGRLDSAVAELLSSISKEPKLYMIVGMSNELDADEIKSKLVSTCDAGDVSSIKSKGYDVIAENASIQDVTREVAKAIKGNNQASVQTIDAQGRPDFEACVKRVVDQAIAATSKASGGVGISKVLIGTAGIALVAGLAV